MGLGRRLRRAVRRVRRAVSRATREVRRAVSGTVRGAGDLAEGVIGGAVDGITGILSGGGKEDNSADELLKYQATLIEEKRKKTQDLIKQQKLKAEEDAKLAEQTAKDQTALTDSQNSENIDFASSGTNKIDTSWLDGVIEEEEGQLENVDENIIV